MATATKHTVVKAEFTLTLNNEEAHELLFYLAQRSRDYKPSRGVSATDGIHAALRAAIN